MADREKNARAQLKLRLPEPIRARLEAEAEQNGYSLNWEVVRRLDQSIKDDDLGKFLFGTRDKFFAAYYFAGIIETLEQKTGKFLTEDPAIFEMAVDAMQHSSIAGIMLPGIGSLGLLMTGRA